MKKNNLKKITYFTGAGASFHSLPLIKTMGERMKVFSTYLKTLKGNDRFRESTLEKFINELDELIKVNEESTSIDAYAKELTNKGESVKLLRLKIILGCYLIFEQLKKPDDHKLFENEEKSLTLSLEMQKNIANQLDKRYRTFWADFIDGKESKPAENIRVLSWNYDMQFELSYSNFKGYSLESVQNEIQVFPSELNEIETSKFCLLKLNGTAGLYRNNNLDNIKNLFDLNIHHLDNSNIDILLDYFIENYRRSKSQPIFSFAWENDKVSNKTRELAREIISDTDILVIIGYSFPSFNRNIDRNIFKNIDKLQKVYFQAPENELKGLMSKLEGINPKLRDIAVGIDNLDTFHVPTEY